MAASSAAFSFLRPPPSSRRICRQCILHLRQTRSLTLSIPKHDVAPTDPKIIRALQHHAQSQAAITSQSRPPTQGSLGSSSIFSTPDAGRERNRSAPPSKPGRHTSQILDPKPKVRIRWERRQVLKSIRTRGAMSKAEIIRRTEREHLMRSHYFKTSYKKLMPLARQIRGKTVAEALLQMRFSPKRAAREVFAQLSRARDEAIVQKGMGLDPGPVTTAAAQIASTATGLPILPDALVNPDSELYRKAALPVPAQVKLKGERTRKIGAPQTLYVSQAWINKGPDRTDMTAGNEMYDYRARGKMYKLKRPTTSISFLLKEQRTLVREARERTEKRDRRKVWSQLPDKGIHAQRQYYCW